MTDGVIVHKMGWCFTCDADDCQHIKNTTQELINALQRKEGKMTKTLTERIKAIEAEAMKDMRENLVKTTDHDLELLTTGNWGAMLKYVAEQILAERKEDGLTSLGA
jgi:hypothetical protein